MKKLFKVLAYLLLAVIVLVVGLLTYVKVALPNVGAPPAMTIEKTPDKVERGRYLANNVAVCMDCHSTRDWGKFALPFVEGTLGKGGEAFDRKYGFPGAYYSRNITPYGIDRYTDGELFRVITTGVTKKGNALFPVMPYPYYGKMDPEDVNCIIAYLRTLPSIKNDVRASVSDFPMNFIINIIPKKAMPQTRPSSSDKLAHGAYLINIAACKECHTKDKQGQIIEDLAYSGGRSFKMPGGYSVTSSNITPDTKTGIGSWTEEAFVNRFKAFADSGYKSPVVPQGGYNTIMPWTMYAKMTREDLAAIYTYLKSLPAKENEVVKYSKG